ncbi:actin-related protein 6 [Musca vetustissima]|uniref:actin-related protein 6 n=1 Tax=Musca vetustissima TaxID=27455 RepID=UPI002AB5FE2C|nr:actin-related protein 6 [Musca vetustissima]
MDDNGVTVVLDNGAYTAKLGLASQDDPQVLLNCIMKAKAERRRAFIGNQIDECRDASGLFYILCFQKGYLLNWDIQKTVWDYFFSNEGTGINLEDRNILVTEPQLNFASIQETMVEILFEEYHCNGIHKTTTAELAAYNYCADSGEETSMQALNCIVVDVGYSFTHVVPFVRGKRVLKGIRRIEVGGKALTNHMKEIISYRHINLMDESYVVNQIKEDVCFVSQNFADDMRVHSDPKKRAEITVEYMLPDFTTVKRGYIRKGSGGGGGQPTEDEDCDQQSMRLCNERFTVPELLFNPSDVGIQQVGIPEAVIDALKDCPAYAHHELLRNILVIGGSSLFPGFVPRLKSEIRALAPDDLEVSLIFPDDPISYGWYGGKEMASSDGFKETLLTRDEYEENGYTASNGR